MTENQIFEFENVQTASPKIAEAYVYLKQMETASEVSSRDDLDSLKTKAGAVAGLVARIKACLCDHLGLDYAEQAAEGTPAASVFSVLSDISDKVFLSDTPSLISAEELGERLRSADVLSSRLPFMIAGLDAGEELSEN